MQVEIIDVKEAINTVAMPHAENDQVSVSKFSGHTSVDDLSPLTASHIIVFFIYCLLYDTN